MTRVERVLFGIACALFGVCGGCASTTEPQTNCDREKRAVWSALGHEDPPPDSLMRVNEWNVPGSARGLEGETYYFMIFAADPSVCHVLRA